MMTPEQLKNSILQCAIEGKLVPQIESEGTGAELLEKIKKSPLPPFKKGGKNPCPSGIPFTKGDKGKRKEEVACPLCKEGGPLAVGDFPFAIPKTWVWCRLGEVCVSIRAGGDKPKIFSSEKTEKLSVPVIANGEKNKGILGYTDKATVLFDSITVSGRGTIGYSCIRREPYCPIVRLLVIEPFKEIDLDFLQKVFFVLLESGVGTSIPQLTVPMMKEKYIPLPPLAEQKRIVAKLEELLPLVDEYAEAYNKLQTLNSKFPTNLKNSLLQYAMEGKLVPCDTSKWKQVKLGDVVEAYSGLSYDKKNLVVQTNDMVTVLRGGNIDDLKYSFQVDDVKISREFIKNNKLYIKKGQLITPAVTSLEKIGKVALIDKDYNNVVAGGFVLNLVPIELERCMPKFLLYIFSSPLVKDRCKKIAHKSGQAFYNLSRNKLLDTVIPLPPLAEQKRIVAKLEELQPLCEEIG